MSMRLESVGLEDTEELHFFFTMGLLETAYVTAVVFGSTYLTSSGAF